MQNGSGQHAFWQPFGNNEQLQALRARMGAPVAIRAHRGDTASVRVAADLYETDDAVVLMIDLPGHDPRAMDLNLDKGILTIVSRSERGATDGREYHLAERVGGVVERSFAVPASVDPERIAATFDAGVLTVTLHKREESKPRKIEVQVCS